MNIGQVLIGLLGAAGAFSGGYAAVQGARNARGNTALDALKLAIETYVHENADLRERQVRMEEKLASCEQEREVDRATISKLERRIERLETK